jgi:hypothetical protein
MEITENPLSHVGRGASQENRQETPPSRIWGEGEGCRQRKQTRTPSVSRLGRGRGVPADKTNRKPLRLAFGAREGGVGRESGPISF